MKKSRVLINYGTIKNWLLCPRDEPVAAQHSWLEKKNSDKRPVTQAFVITIDRIGFARINKKNKRNKK